MHQQASVDSSMQMPLSFPFRFPSPADWTSPPGLQGELNNIRDEIMKFKVGAPARVGLVAPNDVEVPAGGTGLDPSSTNFFQVSALLTIRVVVLTQN